MKTTPSTQPSKDRSLPPRLRSHGEPHRIEPLESRIAPSIFFTPSSPAAPAVNSADRALGTLGGFNPIEPMVTVNDLDPGNVIATSHIGMRITADDGATFAATTNFGNPAGTNTFNGDTDSTFDSTGRLFWVNMAGTGTAGISVNEINPTTGAVISRASVSNNNDDKPMLVADTNPNSPFLDNLYLVWTQFGVAPAQIMFSKSSDHGVTWSAPSQLSTNAESFVWPSDVGVGPNGDVYVTYHSQPGSLNPTTGTNGQTFVLRSTNGGTSFPQKTLAFTPGQSDISYNVQTDATGRIAGTQFWTQGSAAPWVLPDPVRPGHVYVITADDPSAHGTGDDANVMISRSSDFGQTWTTSTVSAGPANSFQLFPTASIDLFGNIVVGWYDNRRGLTNGAGRFLLDVEATYSVDGGLTWAPEFRINDTAFDPDPGAVNRFNGPPATTRIGDYFGIDLFGGTAYLAWNGNSFTGPNPTGQQVLFDSFSIAGAVSVTGDESGTPTDDIFTVRRIAGNPTSVEVLHNGQREYAGLLSGLDRLDIAGLGGNDQLIIDSTNGLLTFPGGIHFDGGGGRDLLQLIQTGGAQTSDVYSVGPDTGAGTSVITGAGGTQSVSFENIEPVIDLVPAATLVVNATPAANEINYAQGSVVANGLVTIDNFESIEFTAKTALTINAGAGSDTISLNNAATPTGLTGGITVNGGDPTGSDTLVVSGTTGLDTINFTPSSSSAGTAQVNALPLITLAGIEHLAIDGQGGGDNFQVNGTASSEFIFHTPLGVQTGKIQVAALLSATYTNVGKVTANGNGGASDTLVVNGRSGDDNFVVLSPSGNIGVTDQTQLAPLSIAILQLNGLEGDDLFTFNRANPYTRIEVNGGSGGDDRLTILGTVGVDDTYVFDPASTVGIGTVTANGVDTDYQGIDRVNVFGNGEAGDTLEVRDSGSDTIWNVAQGSAGDDVVQIDQREALAYRSMGSVTLVNTGGNDLFRIAPTNLSSFSGTFTVNGVSTRDVLELAGTANSDAVTSAAAAITVNGVTITLGNAQFASTQVLGLGGDDNLNLTAFTSTPTVLRGDDGNDILVGSPQADLIFGGAGNDTLIGGAGVDQEYGEDGNDIFGNPTLTSNGVADDAGADFAFGGPGFDNFVWEPGDGADFNNGGDDGADIFRFFGDANANAFTLRPGGTPTHFNALIGAVNIDNHGVEDVVVDGQGGADSFTVNDLFTTEVVSVNLVLGSADAAVDSVIVHGRALDDNLLITTPAAAAVRVSGLRYNVNLTTVEPTDRLTLNGNEGDDQLKAVAGIEALIAITLDGGQGNDTLSADATLLGGIGNDTLIGGLGSDSFDGGAGTDRVVAAGDVNFTLTNTTLTGLGTDSLTAIEEVELLGGVSANTFTVGAYTGRLFLTGDTGADTIDFSTAPGSVIFDLDLLSASQAVTAAGLKVTLGDAIENFTGSPFNDVLFADAAIFARVLNGGVQTVTPPGDKLSFDGRGQVVIVVPVDANTGTIKTQTLADTAYDEFEMVTITNSPSGGGFGPPGSNSNAFTDAHIYDPTTFTIGGKPAAGRGPNSVATGDLNGDGFADMVSANGKTKNISVFLNKGDGTFGEPTNFISAGGPQDLVIADFNGDTKLDVAVTNRLAGNVAIFLGNGAGSFAAPTLIKTPNPPHAIATGDLNGDTFADLVVTLPGTSSISVLLGNGAGGFAVGPKIKVLGTQPRDLVIGDFNGDTKPDVATANYGSANVSFLQGNGAGGFAPAVRFATGMRPTALAIGDINNDGLPDLAVSHLVSRFVSVLFGNGAVPPATQFQPQLRIALPAFHAPNSIVVADFNGDGFADLGLGNSISTTFTILLGTGLGKFTQPYEFDLGRFPRSPKTNGIAVADLNNDGLLDIIATSPNTDDLRVLLRNV